MANRREIKVLITGDADGFTKAAGKAEGAGKSLGKTLAGVGAGIAVGSFVKESIEAASNLEESLSKAKNVFGDSFADIEKNAQNAARTVGLASQDYLAAASGFGNLLAATGGFDNSQLAAMSAQLVTTAADLASFNNTSVEDATAALTSGISGETEPLKRYGIILSDTRLKAEALNLGLIKSAGQELKVQKATQKYEKAQTAAAKALKEHGAASQEYTQAQLEANAALEKVDEAASSIPGTLDPAIKAQAALSLINKDGALAMGDFSETSDGFANSLRIFQATVSDAQAQMAIGFLPVLSAGLQLMTSLGPTGIQAAITIGAITLAFGKLGQAIGGVSTIMTVMSKHPVITGIGLAILGITLLIKYWDDITAAVQRAINKVDEFSRKIAGPAFGPFKAINNALGGDFGKGDLQLGPASQAYLDQQGRATGGNASGNAPYWAGERGPELIWPRGAGAYVSNASESAALMGGGGGVTINVYPTPGMSEIEVARMAKREFDRERRARGLGLVNA